MAIHLADTTTDYLHRTAGLLPQTGPSTVCFWMQLASIPANSTSYILMDDPGTYTDFVAVYTGTTNIDLEGDAAGDVLAPPPTAATWYHVAWVQAGTSLQRLYINGVFKGNITYDRHLKTVANEYLGTDTTGVATDVRFAYMRQWTVALTASEVLVEMQATAAVKTASLYMDCPFTSNLTDISGNGHNWTQVGSGSFVASPSFPSNSLPSTATAFGALPQTITQDFVDGIYAWYSYASITADFLVGFWAFAGLTNTITTTIYYGTPASLSTQTTAVNVPFELPTSGGDTFYFFVTSGAVAPTAEVVVSGQLYPTLSVPVGAIAVNDDGNAEVGANSAEYPVAFLHPTTGSTLTFTAAAAGEAGTVLPPTGQVCLYDVLTESVQLFPSTLGTATATVLDSAIHATGHTASISSDQTTQFYVGGFTSVTTSHVKTVSPDGVVGSTDYAVTTTSGKLIQTIAPSRDNTILYYADTATAAPVRQWDLVNNIALSNFVAGVANHQVCQDTLVLANGNVVVGYKKITPPYDDYVVVYDSAATPVVTINTFGGQRLNRMAQAIDDPDSFWVWLYLQSPSLGFSRFINLNATDGSTITTFDVAQYEQGVYNADAAASPIRFGHSFSCPFWISRGSIAPVAPLEPTLIRRERIFRHLSEEQQWIFYQWLQIDCEAGVGLSEGQGSDPQIILQWSDDGGHTWSNEHLLSAGKQGEYGKRSILKQPLGRSRDRVFKVAMSDPVKWALLNAYFGAEKGTS